jgi:hypothetical protein
VRKILMGAAMGAALLLHVGLATADEYQDALEGKPSAGAMAFDLVLVRPVGLVATVLGAGLFVLQLPLSMIQGTPPSDPAQKLVVEPAAFTFKRPLGAMD